LLSSPKLASNIERGQAVNLQPPDVSYWVDGLGLKDDPETAKTVATIALADQFLSDPTRKEYHARARAWLASDRDYIKKLKQRLNQGTTGYEMAFIKRFGEYLNG
jgi:hypothetical protein